MCNCALGQLSELDVPDLPQSRDDRQVVFASPRGNYRGPPSDVSDIIMVRCERAIDQAVPHSEPYETDFDSQKVGPGLLCGDALLAVEIWKRTKKVPGLHGLISANERLSSYDMMHTMNLLLAGPWLC